MASIGESSEARFAGSTPKIIPISDDTPSATTIEVMLIYAGKTRWIKKTMMNDNSNPANPPMKERITDSARN